MKGTPVIRGMICPPSHLTITLTLALVQRDPDYHQNPVFSLRGPCATLHRIMWK